MKQTVSFFFSVTLYATISFIHVRTAKLPLLGQSDLGKVGSMQGIFLSEKIVPEILPDVPFRVEVAEVTYHNISAPAEAFPVSFGNRIPEEIFEHPPTSMKWPSEKDKLYTVIFTDADANPNSTLRERQLWVLGNCVSDSYKKADTITEYAGPRLAGGLGLRRVVITVFKQKEKIDFKEKKITSPYDEHRENFSTTQFAKKYSLGHLCAANFFNAVHKTYLEYHH